jgi:diguanylate cyclase (GGDEF)-like protein
MSETPDFIDEQGIERLADESGLAIAIVDGSSRQVFVANNNSICRNLNPRGEFVGQCAAFCGTAFEETTEIGASVTFTCHAGLECRTIPIRDPQMPLVAIVGRTFEKAENYRKATTRAIAGDWSQYQQAEFFENILLAGSEDTLDKTVRQAESLLAEAALAAPEPEVHEQKPAVRPAKRSPGKISRVSERLNREDGPEPTVSNTPSGEPAPERRPKTSDERDAATRTWRAFFGSLLKTDYPKAVESILEFLAAQYGFSALIWLEKKENKFESTATFGEMKQRKVRLGLAADDKRLVEALRNEMPLELGERSKDPAATSSRSMNLFPIGVGDDISAAIAILDPIVDENIKKQIARICRSIAPQLEILSLRGEIARDKSLSTAVRTFSEGLKHMNADDLWLKLTQNVAEMLRAERASLLIYDEKAEALEIKAMIGAKNSPASDEEIGTRVAKVVFARNEPLAVSEIAKTGLPPAPSDRKYKTPSFLSCPISISGRNIGVMNFTDQAGGKAFDRSSLDLFQAISPQLAVAIDRATLKEKAGEFEQLSVTDALTGLLNRRYIEERLMEEIKRSNRHGFPMGFMMLDVDHFKSYNDQFGHPAGDEALKLVGRIIRDTLRGADVAARFGGEEFSILLPQTTGEEAAAIAERIRSNIENADFRHRGVTASIGVASCSAELCISADLISAADKALYEAKRQGRNRVLIFEEMTDQ